MKIRTPFYFHIQNRIDLPKKQEFSFYCVGSVFTEGVASPDPGLSLPALTRISPVIGFILTARLSALGWNLCEVFTQSGGCQLGEDIATL